MTSRAETEARESTMHLQLRDALNTGLENNDFFVWISIDPLIGDPTCEKLVDPSGLVDEIEAWLSELDAKNMDQAFPSREFRDPAAAIIITAIAKKPGSRREPGQQIVANPWPVIFEL